MANAYSDKTIGDRENNLERAIEGYESVLEIYTKENFLIDWAMAQNNLANTYRNRIKGNRAENLEKAIKGYKLALDVRKKEEFPRDWAMTQHNLADAYSSRIKGDKKDNLEQAIECCRATLEIYTAKAFPSEWVEVQLQLAQISIDKLNNYQIAIVHLQAAYEQLSTNHKDTGLLAQTMFELARCFHKTGALSQAKIYFKDSIRLYQRLKQPAQVAAVTSELGNLELQMGQIDDARIHLQAALDFYQTTDNLQRIASIQELQKYLPVSSDKIAS